MNQLREGLEIKAKQPSLSTLKREDIQEGLKSNKDVEEAFLKETNNKESSGQD